MAAKAIRFSVLDVGQGTGNFIETFNTKTPSLTTPPAKAFLIDLGSERQKKAAGGPAANWVVTQLNRMTSPELDCVILSHSDSDHINLLDMVLAAFDPPRTARPTKPILTVKKGYYGGNYGLYAKRSNNILKKLEKYSPDSLASFSTNESSFSASSPKPLRTVDGVDLYLMIANAGKSAASPPAKKKRRVDSFAINTKSLVVVVSWGVQYIATGDATGVTLARCNDEVTGTIKKNFLPSVVMLTMPHHGSETTTFNITGISGGRDDKAAVKNVETFVAKTAPASVTASAERVKTFKHPSAFLLQFFWKVIRSGDYKDPILRRSQHYYTAYFTTEDGYKVSTGTTRTTFPKSDSWYTVQTAKDIFTNLYFDPSMVPDKTRPQTVQLPPNPGSVVSAPSKTPYPPLGVAWVYLTPEGQGTKILRLVNRPALLALQRQLVAAVTATPNRTEADAVSASGLRRWSAPVAELHPPAARWGAARSPKIGAGGSGLAGLKALL